MATQKEELHAKAQELHTQYVALVTACATKAAPQVLRLRPPDDVRELDARRWAGLRVVLLDAGFSYAEGVTLAKLLAALVVQGLWPQDADALAAQAVAALCGAPPKTEANTYGLQVLVRRYATRLTGSPYDSHEFVVLSISRRLRSFLRQCEEQGIARELVVEDLARSAELQAEMVYRVETAGKRVTAPMLLRLDKALRRAEMEAANG